MLLYSGMPFFFGGKGLAVSDYQPPPKHMKGPRYNVTTWAPSGKLSNARHSMVFPMSSENYSVHIGPKQIR